MPRPRRSAPPQPSACGALAAFAPLHQRPQQRFGQLKEAEGLILQQLQNQRSAVSGISLDEEAANLLRSQRAFEAAARVVSVVNELTDTAIPLGSAP